MKKQWIACILLCSSTQLFAAEKTVMLSSTEDNKTHIGSVKFEDTAHGLLISPSINNLPAGIHGFHIHEKPDCGSKGTAAGGHYDPEKTESHQGPYGKGHLGDLPVLYVDKNSQATLPTLAPRLKVSDLKGRSLMIHAGGDNYSDNPPLGGGGARVGCGVID